MLRISRRRWQILKIILTSLNDGYSINRSCKRAHISVVSFYKWRKKDKRLDDLVNAIYESKIQMVEDSLFENATRHNNVMAQIFFLKNRQSDRWKDITKTETPALPPPNTFTFNNLELNLHMSEEDKITLKRICQKYEQPPT